VSIGDADEERSVSIDYIGYEGIEWNRPLGFLYDVTDESRGQVRYGSMALTSKKTALATDSGFAI
jgi:hypothetical protein